MRYLSIGYYTLYLSIFLSLIIYILIPTTVGASYDWFLAITSRIVVHAFIIAIQILGIVLCMWGLRKEKTGERLPLILPNSIFLILWGSFVSLFAINVYYSEYLPRSEPPEMMEITVLDNLEFGLWTLKGLLWIASGLIFISTTLIQRHAHAR